MNPFPALARRTCVLAALLGATVVAQAQITVSTTNTSAVVVDDSSLNRLLTFAPGDIAFPGQAILDVNISITFAKADGESLARPFPTVGRPFYNEISLVLARGATSVSLVKASTTSNGIPIPGSFSLGASGTFFDDTILFDDEAAGVVNVNPDLIQAGTFKPVSLLSAFDGQLFTPGDWTLTLSDFVEQDALRFYEATLSVTYAGGTPTPQLGAVPEPSTYGLIGAALLGGLVVRRRFRAVKAAK